MNENTPVHPALERLHERHIIAIVRGVEGRYLRNFASAIGRGGIDMIEITFDQKRPESFGETAEAISLLAKSGDVLPGAGTVLTEEQVQMAYDAGAAYIVSPGMDPAVIRKTKALGMASFPGALTPTEIYAAHTAGADAVKLFPVSALGPGFIKALRGPLPHIPLIAVGGVDEKNAGDYIQAGAIGVGVGGKLTNMEWIVGMEWGRIEALARAFARGVKE